MTDEELDVLRGKYDLAYGGWGEAFERGLRLHSELSPSKRLEAERTQKSLEDDLYAQMEIYRTQLKAELDRRENPTKRTWFTAIREWFR